MHYVNEFPDVIVFFTSIITYSISFIKHIHLMLDLSKSRGFKDEILKIKNRRNNNTYCIIPDVYCRKCICLPTLSLLSRICTGWYPLKCSVDSNFPAGTTFDVVMYPPGYTTNPLYSQTVTIQENHATQYQIFDTSGLPGGQYRVEIQFIGPDEDRLSSDGFTLQLPRLIESPVASFSGIPRTGVAPLTCTILGQLNRFA